MFLTKYIGMEPMEKKMYLPNLSVGCDTRLIFSGVQQVFFKVCVTKREGVEEKEKKKGNNNKMSSHLLPHFLGL